MNHSLVIRYDEKWDYLSPSEFMKVVRKYNRDIEDYCKKHKLRNSEFIFPLALDGMKQGEYLHINLTS